MNPDRSRPLYLERVSGPAASAFTVLALLIIPQPLQGLAQAQAGAQGTRTGQDQVDPDEKRGILERMNALGDSITAASRWIAAGELELERLRAEVRLLEERMHRTRGAQEDVQIQTRLFELRRRIMESRLRGSILRWPEIDDIDPSITFQFDPDFAEMRGTSIREGIFRIGEDVEVGVFEKVRGDVVVIGADVRVRGAVTGNVIAVGGGLHITSTGRVDGDALNLGGTITQDPGGTVRGAYIDTFGPFNWPFFGRSRYAWLAISIAGFAFVLIAALIVGIIVPGNVEQVESQVRKGFGTSFLVGLLFEVLFPVLFVLLIITIVGIPVALILLPVAAFGLFLLGFTGVALAVGRGISQRGLSMGSSPLAAIALGTIAVQLLYLLGRAVRLTGGMLGPLGMATQVLGLLVLYLVWTSGLGAALLTRFGTRERSYSRAPKAAPPPVGAEG